MLAKENYIASHPDKVDNIKFVIGGDDVGVGRSQGSIVGRRYYELSSLILSYHILNRECLEQRSSGYCSGP